MTETMRVLVGLLADVRNKLTAAGISRDAEAYQLLQAALDRLEQSLKRPPTVLVAGEANSGKTSVANLLAGLDALPAAVVANTSVPVRLRHGEEPSVFALTGDGRVPLSLTSGEALPQFLYSGIQSIEVEWPTMDGDEFEVLDTPPWPVANELIRDVDIVLWCSVAARPWTETERQAITGLPDRLRSRSILVVTHEDALGESDKPKVMERYRQHAGELFSDIIMIDATGDRYKSAVDYIGPLVEALNETSGRHANPLIASNDDDPGVVAGLEDDGGAMPASTAVNDAEISAQEKLRLSLAPLLATYWTHRSVTGRRLCRHLAHALTPLLPAAKLAEDPAASYEADPEGALYANIASRLATA